MKKLFGLFAFALLSNIIYAQKNNPYDKVGTDFVASYNIVKRDFEAKKITAIDQKTLDYYSANTPIKVKVSVDNAAFIAKSVKGSTLADVLKTSGFSAESKEIITKAANGGDVSKLVESAKISKSPALEKEKVLSILSVIHNANAITTLNDSKRGKFWGTILGAIVGGITMGPAGIIPGATVGGMVAESKD